MAKDLILIYMNRKKNVVKGFIGLAELRERKGNVFMVPLSNSDKKNSKKRK